MQAKRWLSGLVACAMLVTMLPTQVFALESDAADTWSKTLNAEELYALIQDKLDENGSIGLADLADSEAGTDTNDGVQGTLTAVAFDSGDKIELSALADGDTSYTLTFTDDDTSEPDSGLPAETGDMTEPPQEDGQPVAPGATPADDSTASDTTSGTDPPTAEESSAQGQEGTVDLRVTTQETYATEAEADAQAAEQGKDPEADVAVQTDEATGTVLGAMLTVDEEQVDAVTLYYTADEAEDAPAAQPDNAISTMRWPDQPEYSRTYTINVGESEDISGGAGWYAHDHQWQSSAPSVVSVRKDPHAGYKATITGESVGDATIITHTWKTGIIDIESHQEKFLVNVTQKSYGEVTFKVYYIIGNEPKDLAKEGDAKNYGPAGNNTPLVHLKVDIDELLKTYPDGLVSTGDDTWYITYKSCDENKSDWWKQVLECTTDESKKALEATGLSGLFEGYVLKDQSNDPDDQYHLDGTVQVQPPVYSAELHLNGDVVRAIMESEQFTEKKDGLRTAYEKAIQEEYDSDVKVTWYDPKQDSVVGFFVADDGTTYLLKEEGTNDPEQSILGNETVKFTKKSNLYHVASFYLTIEEAPATVTAEDVIGSFYKRLDMGDQSVREPYLEEAFEGGDTFSFKLSKLEAKQDSNTEYEIAGAPVATATVTFNQKDILNSIGDKPYLFKSLVAKNGNTTLENGYYILQEDFETFPTFNKQVQNNNSDLSWKNANGERKGEHGYIIRVENGKVTYMPNMAEDSIIINDVYKFKTLEDTAPTEVYSENDEKGFDKFNNVFENDFASYSVTYNWGQDYTVSGFELPAEKYYSEKATVTVANFENDVYATNGGQTYKFTGWKATTSNPDVAAPDISSGQFNMPAANVTLTAQWETVNTVNDLLAMFQKTAVLGAGSDSSVQAPNETFTFTLTKDGEQTATATATVTNWDTPAALMYTPDATTQVLTGDISTEIPMLEDGEYTLTEDDISTPGWTKDRTEYTITIMNGEMMVTGGTADQDNKPYTFTNTYFKPYKPGEGGTEIPASLTAKVDCTNETATTHEEKTYPLNTDNVDFSPVEMIEGAWTTTATIDTTAIASWYDGQVGATDHEVVTPDPEGDVREITLKWKDNAWTVDEDKSQFIVSVVCEQPILSVTKALTKVNDQTYTSGSQVQVGDTLTYTITVTNSGNAPATGVSVADILTADNTPVTGDVQLTLDSASNGESATSFTVSANGGSKTLTATYKVTEADAGKTLSNTAEVTYTEDPDNTIEPEDPVVTQVKEQFTVTYKFVSDTDDMELPPEVTVLLPTSNPETVTAGETVTLADPADMQVNVDGGMWLFRFWSTTKDAENATEVDEEDLTIHADTTYYGHWEFAPDMFTLDSVLAHFRKQLIVNGKNDLGGGRIFAFELTAENGASLTKNIFAEAKLNSDGTVTVPLTTTETSVFLPVGTYTLTEYAAADDRDQGTWNLADSVTFTLGKEDYQPVITINGRKLAEDEVYTFTNTYTGPQIGTEEPDPSDPDIPTTADQAPTKTPVTKAGFDELASLTPVDETIWNALSAQTVWPVKDDADNWSLTVPAGEESTTYVLYDVAINGDIGAEFTVTDEDATLVAYQGASTIADGYMLSEETAHFYFAKTADQAVNGNLENIATVTDKNNPGEEPDKDPVPDPEAPDIPVITEGVTAEKHVVTSPEGISLEGVNVKYPADGTVTIAKPDDENAVLLYAVTVKGAANANFTLTEEPYVVYIPSDDGTTLTPNGNGNTYTGTLPADGEATFYFTKPITGEGKMKNTVVLNDDTSNPIESGETEIIETKDPTDPENPGYVTITFYEGNHGTLSKDTDDNGVYTVTIERGSRLTPDNLTDVLADAGYYFTGWQNANGTYSESELLGLPFVSDTAFTAQYQTMPNQIIVYYDDDGSGYGEVTSDHRQVFTAGNWEPIEGDPTHVRIHLTATAEDDGGRTYFDEWQGSLVDDLDDDIREDEELSARVVAEIGQTYTVIADFGRRSSGGGGGGGNRDDDDDEEEIIDEEVPLAETPWLNTVDHYAYIVGYAEDGTVRPNANITRAEVATIFFRLLTDEARNSLWSTTNTFSDVASTAWYNTAVSTMANAGIIQGYEDGTFRPNANITRAEFAAIAARFMTSGYDVESDLFTDIAGHWARESINDAATAGWINGYSDDTFRPDNAITRAEAVTLVNNVLQRKPDADHMLDSMITWPDNPESAWYYEAIQEATNSHDYDMPSEDDDVDYETWTALQENRDWAALEAQWSAEHAYGGDVM